MIFEDEKARAELEAFAEKNLNSKYYHYSIAKSGLTVRFRCIISQFSYNGEITMDPSTGKCFYRLSFLTNDSLPEKLICQLEKKWTMGTYEVFCITQRDSVRNSPRNNVVNTQIIKTPESDFITCEQHSHTFEKLIERSVEVYNLSCETISNPPDSWRDNYEQAVKDVISNLGVDAEFKYREGGIDPYYGFWWDSGRDFSITPLYYRVFVEEACTIEAEAPAAFYTETPEAVANLCKRVSDVKRYLARRKSPYWNCDIYPEDNKTCRIVFYVTLVTNISEDQIKAAIVFLEDVVNRYIPRLEGAE